MLSSAPEQRRDGHVGLRTAVVILWMAAGASVIHATDRSAVEPFEKRVDAYVALRRGAAARVPKPAVSSEPEAIGAAVDALAEAIRSARPHAKIGDVFTRQSAFALRRRIEEVLTQHGRKATDLLADIDREGPVLPADLTVNGRFDWRYGALMPADLIEALPPLPAFLQYRFVNRDLVLVDVEADLIVDVLPGALAVNDSVKLRIVRSRTESARPSI